MTNLFCVRADFGTYTKQFVDGGFVAIAWMPNTDLSAVHPATSCTRSRTHPLAGPAPEGDVVGESGK